MTETRYDVPDWRRAFGEPVIACQVRNRNADFQVAEKLGFEPCGDGEHDYLRIQKDGANTSWVARGLAEYAGVAAKDVGFAGFKDRHAVTRQWFSVRRPAGNKADWQKLELEGVIVLEINRHRRKLRRGAHTGNRFRIALTELTGIHGNLEDRLRAIKHSGVPNYFGEQRFGRDGGNLSLALDLFAGRRVPGSKRSMALSAPRSFLFNKILEQRVIDGSWNSLLPGDWACLDGSASVFRVDAVDAELQSRCDALDLHPSGALWGAGDLPTSREIGHLEASAVGAYPEFTQGLEQASLQMARRALRLAVRDFSWHQDDDTLCLNFFLMRGGFATAVLREIAAYEDDAGR